MNTATAVPITLDPDNPRHGTAWWLLTGPWHPLWTQFTLSVIPLRDTPGLPPAKLHYPGATHELLVMALNPCHIHTPQGLANDQPLHYLEPYGVRGTCQIYALLTAADEELPAIAEACAKACISGELSPLPGPDPAQDRAAWANYIARLRAQEAS